MVAEVPGARPARPAPRKGRIVGDLGLPREPADPTETKSTSRPNQPLDVIVELNMSYPGGLEAVTPAFMRLLETLNAVRLRRRRKSERLPVVVTRLTARLYQCVVTRQELADLLDADSGDAGSSRVIFKVWPDYPMYAQIDRSAPTVKVDAAKRAFNATGTNVVWAVVDTGIDATHPHFSALELSHDDAKQPATGGRHRDFSALVQPSSNPPEQKPSPLTDEEGHGTHVAGIIAGACPDGKTPHVAASTEATDGGFVARAHGHLQGMAPACELVSLKVFRRITGVAVTSSAAVIAALEYIRTEVNVSRSTLKIHGVNLSLGCEWDPAHYAAGQSPLCQLIDELVASGVVVVISAGNNGGAGVTGTKQFVGVGSSITEPGHAAGCITVGSTHREAPHVFGISYSSSKGPTLDGRPKPDVVAPGEWICSAATGFIRSGAGLDGQKEEPMLTYAEQSGTSMAAPHVSGVIAGFLSARPEYIGRPAEVKTMLTSTATDLGRDRYAQGAGLADAMRMLSNS